jgi:hypothetical protein
MSGFARSRHELNCENSENVANGHFQTFEEPPGRIHGHLRALARAAWIGEFGPLDAVVLHESDPEDEHVVTVEKLAVAVE